MDARKMERLRQKAGDIVNEKAALFAQLALCRRHFLSASGSPSLTRASIDSRTMTLNLASAAMPLFRITNRASTSLWTRNGDSEMDLRNFLGAIEADIEMVCRLGMKSCTLSEQRYYLPPSF